MEVLKGPQGTLFGRNAVAGVIHVITKDPSDTPSLDASIGYGNYQTVDAGIYATGGILPNLAADLAISYHNQLDGWGKNLATGRDAFKDREFAARTKWKLSLGDATTVTLGAHTEISKAQMASAWRHIPGAAFPANPLYRDPIGFYDIRLILDPTFYRAHPEPGTKKKQFGTNLRVNHDLDWANLVSISAYEKVDTVWRYEISATPVPGGSFTFPINSWSASQELQLVSAPSSPIKWIGGLFYFRNWAGYRDSFASGALFGGGSNFQGRHSGQDLESYAAFGQVTVPITSTTNAEAGVRYTHDKRHLKGYIYSPAGVTGGAAGVHDKKADFSKVTYRFSLDQKLSKDVMVYASYGRGFKGGVFNTFVPADPAALPEVIDAYEVGLKSEWLDNRVRTNLGAFLNKYKNIQIAQIVDAFTLSNRITNAARAESKGVEAEVQALVADGLSLTGSITVMRAKFKSFPSSVATVINPNGGVQTVARNVTGNRLIQAPDLTAAITVNYTIPTDSGDWDLFGNYAYNDGFFWAAGNRLKQPSYSLVNASVRWTAPSGTWDVTLWGKNLTDKKYYSYVNESLGDLGSPAPPMTFGIKFGVHL